MATSGRGSGIVGYNVQSVVGAKHHLIVAHEVVMTGSDRRQLANMSGQAKAAMGVETLEVLADRGYFSGEEIVACEALGVTPFVPKPLTSGAKADGRFGKQDFTYLPDQDVYRYPARAAPAHDDRREGADAGIDVGTRRPEAGGHPKQGAARHPLGA
jgi:transposase